jgi:adenylate kinase
MPETISRRLDVYADQTQPLMAHYASHGLLVTIEATGSVDEVAERAIAALRQSA